MNKINPEKLLHSKWTSKHPLNREKHFMVTSLIRNEECRVIGCELQAVINGNSNRINWTELENNEQWQFGWQ